MIPMSAPMVGQVLSGGASWLSSLPVSDGTSGLDMYLGWYMLLPEPEFAILSSWIGEHLMLLVDESRTKSCTIPVIYYMVKWKRWVGIHGFINALFRSTCKRVIKISIALDAVHQTNFSIQFVRSLVCQNFLRCDTQFEH